jgi:YYY domain-containing protein
MLASIIIAFFGYLVVSRLQRFGYKDKYQAFNFLILLMAFAIIFGVELVRIKGDIDRMNTVFKFYLQAWVLLGIGCSFLFWRCFQTIKEKGKTKIKASVFIASSFLIVCGLIYPVFATHARIEDRFIQTKPTLNGKTYMSRSTYLDERGEIDLSFDGKAIKWMNNNLQGTPVILEANTPMYRWGSRISIYTGYPTILGWRWHQEQQRMNQHSEIQKRISDINIIYETENVEEALELIKKYQVKYIYIGDLEKLYYSSKGLSKFRLNMKTKVEVVYSNEKVDIYKVN